FAGGAAGRQATRGSLVRRRALGATRVGRLPRPRGGHGDADARGSHRAVLRVLTMRLEVEHAFAFEYDGYISESFLELRVQPKTTPTQTVLSFTLAVGGPVRLTPALRAAHGALAVPRGAPLDEQVLAMGRALRGRFEYQKDVTRYDSTTEDFLKLGQGVCQDFAHLMLGWLRLSGI